MTGAQSDRQCDALREQIAGILSEGRAHTRRLREAIRAGALVDLGKRRGDNHNKSHVAQLEDGTELLEEGGATFWTFSLRGQTSDATGSRGMLLDITDERMARAPEGP